MIDYRSFDAEELATDEMFRRWVIEPGAECAHFWNQWLIENPDRAEAVRKARELVFAVNELYQENLPEHIVNQDIAELTKRAELIAFVQEEKSRYWATIGKVAAAIVLVAGLGWTYYITKPAPELADEARVQQISQEMEVHTNSGQSEMTVLLSDNSIATLSKGSTIRFPKHFDSGERRVYLTGEAFFDVSKNPEQPFLVYTDETVTKVLGTSFRVKEVEAESTVLVAVKTGSVSVYPKQAYEKAAGTTERENAAVILAPNQQAVFLRKENRLEKGTVMRPEMLAESGIQKDQIFEDKPVTHVLQALEKSYGIQIQYKAEVLTNCQISAQFSDENLKQRLSAICQAIGASYEVVAGQVVINAKGCI